MFFFFFTSRYLSGFAGLDQNPGFTLREDWIKKAREAIRAAKTVRPAEKSREYRANGQDYQWHGHRHRRLVDVVFDVVAHARLAVKREINQAEHVESGHQRCGIADEPENAIRAAFRRPGLP